MSFDRALDVFRAEISKLEMKPGDTLVLKVEPDMSNEDVHFIKHHFNRRKILPKGCKLLLIPNTVELTVIKGYLPEYTPEEGADGR